SCAQSKSSSGDAATSSRPTPPGGSGKRCAGPSPTRSADSAERRPLVSKLCRVRRVRASAWSSRCPGDLGTARDGHRRGNGQGRRIFAAACGEVAFRLDLQAPSRALPPFERMMVGETPVPVGEKETDLRPRFCEAADSKDAYEMSE